tara:strand:- start:2403 stop:2663 length:261 start_codon:yes stop_codon:yes gene_type:complete
MAKIDIDGDNKADFSLSLANIIMIVTMIVSIVGSYYSLNNKINLMEIEIEKAKEMPPQSISEKEIDLKWQMLQKEIDDIKQNFRRK